MKKIFIYSLLLLLSATAYCEQMSKIELTDGSIINAEIISLDNGVYTLNAESLGRVKIDASKIRKVEAKNENTPSTVNIPEPSDNTIKSGVDKYKTIMMGDPQILKIANDLAMDPQFQEIIKDPQIANAINSGDIQALMSNQKFMNIINHPKIEEIKDKLKQ